MAIFSKKKDDNHSNLESVEQKDLDHPDEPADDTVETKMYYPDYWDLTTKDRYVYQYYHRKLPKLKKGQISISGMKFLEVDGEMVVEAFIRNTVPKAVKIQAVDLVVYDENDQLAAKKRFSLDQLGELPPFSCTPCRFLFLAEDRVSEAAVSDKWKILFEMKTDSKEEVLDLDPSWEEKITQENKHHFETLLKNLPPLGPKEVNLYGAELNFLDNQSLQAIILIRNGTSQNMRLDQLPLTVEDADGDIVCQGLFKLPPLTVKPRAAKPWVFVFPPDLTLKKEADLSKWRIVVKQNQQ